MTKALFFILRHTLYNLTMLKPSDVKELYDKYNVQASKRFGQNFLVDQNILRNIIRAANIESKDVVEIGPGLGSLTLYLIKDAKHVTSYEIDLDMIRVLNGEIDAPNFELVEGDFLKAELNWEGKKTVVANIPYNITSDILFKLFENSQRIDKAVIMMQKEVAHRLTSPVGSKDYGKLTISAQHFANVKYEFTVPENAFIPAPKVKSAVVTFDFKDVDYDKSLSFLKFIKQSFAMRRKTLYNNLKNFLGAEKATEILEKSGLKEGVRPQELSYEQFVKLFDLSL